jgi:hypothetical protein
METERPHASKRQRQIVEHLAIALRLMNSPRGMEAVEGGYYLPLFTWLFAEIERGRIPAGVPIGLLEEWKQSKPQNA